MTQPPTDIDWSIFDKEYPVKNGIVVALPQELNYTTDANPAATHFFDVHSEILQEHKSSRLLEDKKAMARLQKDFYDKMAIGFQHMDDSDLQSGGIFWWKINRLAKYDEQFFRRPKMLFIGAGNCRIARIYAEMGYDVTATDISINMLAIGKQRIDKENLKMTYVAQNAEVPFPFKDEIFDVVYSLCVVNHIVDWKNYFSEKLRCLKPGGVLLERMPNAKLWSFWNTQGELNEGVEIKARHCHRESAKAILSDLGVQGDIWTHDRLHQIDTFRVRRIPRGIRLKVSKLLYDLRSFQEDKIMKPHKNYTNDDDIGIYTMIKVVKKTSTATKNGF